MIIVSDTSPLCYLILIDCIEVLPKLYGQIIIPQIVYQELIASGTPEIVKNWCKNIPEWLIIQTIDNHSDLELEQLDPGEKSAIMLAEQVQANLIILDEKFARRIAKNRGLNVIGLLGILYDACLAKLIEPTKFKELQETNFFVSPKLIKDILDKINNKK
jgi:predicted nucleic acid-binding protein